MRSGVRGRSGGSWPAQQASRPAYRADRRERDRFRRWARASDRGSGPVSDPGSGSGVGSGVGVGVGSGVGSGVGVGVGAAVGVAVGPAVGVAVGPAVGVAVGAAVGPGDALPLGLALAPDVGAASSVAPGVASGSPGIVVLAGSSGSEPGATELPGGTAGSSLPKPPPNGVDVPPVVAGRVEPDVAAGRPPACPEPGSRPSAARLRPATPNSATSTTASPAMLADPTATHVSTHDRPGRRLHPGDRDRWRDGLIGRRPRAVDGGPVRSDMPLDRAIRPLDGALRRGDDGCCGGSPEPVGPGSAERLDRRLGPEVSRAAGGVPAPRGPWATPGTSPAGALARRRAEATSETTDRPGRGLGRGEGRRRSIDYGGRHRVGAERQAEWHAAKARRADDVPAVRTGRLMAARTLADGRGILVAQLLPVRAALLAEPGRAQTELTKRIWASVERRHRRGQRRRRPGSDGPGNSSRSDYPGGPGSGPLCEA